MNITLEPYTGQGKLRFWCQKVLPLVYDDSLSYYEVLGKVVDYLNHTIEDVGACEDNITALRDAFVQLQDYVNEMFDDFSPEIEHIIDEMIDSGEFGKILTDAVNGLIASEYDEETPYLQFAYCLKDGKLYCATASTTGTWDETKWRKTTIGNDLQLISRRLYNLNAGQVEYNSKDTYNNATVGKELQELTGSLTAEETNIKNKTVFLNNKVLNAQHNSGNETPELTIVHFSDIHKDTAALARIMSEVEKLPNVDDIICTGDIVQNTYGEIESWWNPNILTVIGNHDTASYQNDEYNWTYLPMADRSSLYIEPFKNNWNVQHINGNSYYYKDYATKKVRLIVLDGMLYMASDTAQAVAQTNWLTSLLDSAITNNLHVLIAIHAPSVGAMPLHCDFTKLNETPFPNLRDCVTPTSIPSLIETKKANGLNFIGYICGHWHQDGIYYPNFTKQLEYCITTANVSDENQWMQNDQFRNDTMDAYNIISIDTSSNTIKIVRGGGADIDCYMRPRKEISFNYSERRINTLAPLEDSQYYDANNALSEGTTVNISEYLKGNYLIVTCARFGYQATEIIPISILKDSAPRMYFYNSSGANKNTVLKFWADGRMLVESTTDPVFVLLAQI